MEWQSLIIWMSSALNSTVYLAMILPHFTKKFTLLLYHIITLASARINIAAYLVIPIIIPPATTKITPVMINRTSFGVFASCRIHNPPSVEITTFNCEIVYPTATPLISFEKIIPRLAIAKQTPVAIFCHVFAANSWLSCSNEHKISIVIKIATDCGKTMSQPPR